MKNLLPTLFICTLTLISLEASAENFCHDYHANKGDKDEVVQICADKQSVAGKTESVFTEPSLVKKLDKTGTIRVASGLTPGFRARKICTALGQGAALSYSIDTCASPASLLGVATYASEKESEGQTLNCFASVTCAPQE